MKYIKYNKVRVSVEELERLIQANTGGKATVVLYDDYHYMITIKHVDTEGNTHTSDMALLQEDEGELTCIMYGYAMHNVRVVQNNNEGELLHGIKNAFLRDLVNRI